MDNLELLLLAAQAETDGATSVSVYEDGGYILAAFGEDHFEWMLIDGETVCESPYTNRIDCQGAALEAVRKARIEALNSLL